MLNLDKLISDYDMNDENKRQIQLKKENMIKSNNKKDW